MSRLAARHPSWLVPDWPLPGIGAVMTTRLGGIGTAPFDSFNLRDGLGDAPAAVAHNRQLLEAAIGVRRVDLHQVHGATVVRLDAADLRPDAVVHSADASVTTWPGIACSVQVADCLPVLFAAGNARAVGAAHAGWRGLAAGVLEATLTAVCEAAACAAIDVHAWLGPCIGPACFEVGADVLKAFGVAFGDGASPRFTRRGPADGPVGDQQAAAAIDGATRWLADLPGLARDRLQAAGVASISGGTWCTASDASRFFSFRRDGLTGRMVAAVWIEPEAGIDRG